MREHQAVFPVATQCRVLEVSTSGYYAWHKRTPSLRSRVDAQLQERIVALHRASRSTYGAPRLRADLVEEGTSVSRKRVARLMRRAGIRGVTRRGFTVTTRRDRSHAVAPDLLRREFVAQGPNETWVADITYVPTWAGFLYLAVVIDLWSRRVVGWAMRTHLRTELVTEALEMAIERRRPKGVIHHSDQGSQYTSLEFGARCRKEGIRPSMGSVGDCYDNALCESFFATLECELLDRSSFRNPNEARLAVFDFIEGFYNTRRRHSALGQVSPVVFERTNEATHAAFPWDSRPPEAHASGSPAQAMS